MIVLFQWVLTAFLAISVPREPELRPVSFEITNAGITVNGYFDEQSHTLRFDPKNLKESTLEGRAKVSTIHTGIALRDRHLQGRQYFKSDVFPEIVMKSKSITSQGKNNYLGVFEVRIKDVAKELTVPFQVENLKNERHYKTHFKLNRLDFGLGEKSLVLSDEVTVIVHIVDRME
jgi:polyisoprenoid-binding protein YceI